MIPTINTTSYTYPPQGAVMNSAPNTNNSSNNTYTVGDAPTNSSPALTPREFASSLKTSMAQSQTHTLYSADGIDNRLFVEKSDRDDFQPRSSSAHSARDTTIHSNDESHQHQPSENQETTEHTTTESRENQHSSEHAPTESPTTSHSTEKKDNGVIFNNGADNAGIVGKYEGAEKNWHALQVAENASFHRLYDIDPYTAYHNGHIDRNSLISFNNDEDAESYKAKAEEITPQHLRINKEQGREYAKQIEQDVNEGKMPAKQGLDEMRRVLGAVNYTLEEDATALDKAVSTI